MSSINQDYAAKSSKGAQPCLTKTQQSSASTRPQALQKPQWIIYWQRDSLTLQSRFFCQTTKVHAFAHERSTKAPEGTTTGVTTGGVIGGTLGLLAGIGALAIPGVGPLIAAGPIMATLAGVGVGGTVGGFVGALVGMGIPEYEAKRYEGDVKGGGTLLSVHCDIADQIDAAKAALKETGARDISSSSEAGSNNKSGSRETYGLALIARAYAP
jgi:hypothetical protein